AAAATAPEKRAELHARASELEARHAVEWLGPIGDVVPPEHVVFDRGLVKKVAAHLDGTTGARVLDAPEWGSVEELFFLPQSAQRFSSAMKALRVVGPLDATGLAALR